MFIKLIKLIDAHFEEFLCSIMLGFIAVSMNIEIFNRYILFSPSAYTDEIDRMLMLFIVFLGVPWAVKVDKHIIIDLWSREISPKSKLILDIICLAIFFTFSLIFAHAGYEATEFHHMLGSKTEALGFSYWIQLAMLPFAFSLTCLRVIQKIFICIAEYKRSTASVNSKLAQGEM